MGTERTPTPPKENGAAPKQPGDPSPIKNGRSGEGARSVIPHLRADQRARAMAGIAKRQDRS